jgi:uncharacterized protein (DUF58 family)
MAGLSARQSGNAGATKVRRLEGEAHSLVDRLPEILIEASRIAATVAHGIHGRRRAGPGETFWQFRQLEAGDSAGLVDWRRSASSDHLYVRQREWEAAHTLWLWPDISRSMAFRSHLAPVTKADRALVLALAAAEMLVRGGERVGLLGLTRPTASRKATTKLAETIAADSANPTLAGGLPPKVRIGRFSGAILISDFLDPLPDLRASLEALAAEGANGHLVQVLDPAEETLPYEGRTEFIAPEGHVRFIADRAESVRREYAERLEAHRAEVRAMATRFGWSFLVHHTDRPASETLLALFMRLSAQASGDYRWKAASPTPSREGGP